MQDGSNRYGWDGKVEIRARVIRTGKQDGTLKGRQAGRQAESSAGLKAAEFGTKKTTTGGKVPRCNRPLAPAMTES